MKGTATILEDGEHGGVVGNGRNSVLRKMRGKPMEHILVNMKNAGGFGKLRGIPVVVSRKNGGLGFRIDSKDEGFGRLRSGKNETGGEKEEKA